MILPTYREMKKAPDFRAEAFHVRYNIIVEEEAFSIFTHSGITAQAAADTIEAKLKKNASYGIHYVNIHAINEANIKTVRNALKLLEDKREDIEKVSEQKTGKTLFVRLESADNDSAAS